MASQQRHARHEYPLPPPLPSRPPAQQTSLTHVLVATSKAYTVTWLLCPTTSLTYSSLRCFARSPSQASTYTRCSGRGRRDEELRSTDRVTGHKRQTARYLMPRRQKKKKGEKSGPPLGYKKQVASDLRALPENRGWNWVHHCQLEDLLLIRCYMWSTTDWGVGSVARCFLLYHLVIFHRG